MTHTLAEILTAVREEFEKELAAKTGWGRVELLAAHERAINAALLRFIKL